MTLRRSVLPPLTTLGFAVAMLGCSGHMLGGNDAGDVVATDGNSVADAPDGSAGDVSTDTACAMTACYTGPANTRDVGACHAGVAPCGPAPSACIGEVVPAARDLCGNGIDDDCNGVADDGCASCTPGAMQSCYAGPAGTAGQGACAPGMQRCRPNGTWDPNCRGEVLPAPESCNGVDDDCDGVVDGTSASGACSQPSNGAAVCMGGTCGITCASGFVSSAGQCVTAGSGGVARLIAPLSGTHVASARPAFRWALPDGADGATIDLCHDRACTMIAQQLTATGTSLRVTSPLATGAWFWRAHASTAGTASSATSAVWEFWVGAGIRPMAADRDGCPDFDGDGRADMVVGAPGTSSQSGAVWVFAGATGASLGTNGVSIPWPLPSDTADFGAAVSGAGDVNGDGFSDLLVGADYVGTFRGEAYLYLGGPSGVRAASVRTIYSPGAPHGNFGSSVSSAGDVNGDGWADVVVAQGGGSAQYAYVYLGGSGGLASSPSAALLEPVAPNAQQGRAAVGANDVNGDGFADVLVAGDPTATPAIGATLYLGSAAGISTANAVPIAWPVQADASMQFSVAATGDTNADGYADVLIRQDGAYWFQGAATGAPMASGGSITAGSLDGAGDVNGDGYDDVVWSGVGVALYLGGANGLAAAPSSQIPGNATGTTTSAGAGDVNGDGYDDVMIGQPFGSGMGSAAVLPGSGAGIASSTQAVLTHAGATGDSFGQALAMRGATRATSFTRR